MAGFSKKHKSMEDVEIFTYSKNLFGVRMNT